MNVAFAFYFVLMENSGPRGHLWGKLNKFENKLKRQTRNWKKTILNLSFNLILHLTYQLNNCIKGLLLC